MAQYLTAAVADAMDDDKDEYWKSMCELINKYLISPINKH